MGSGSFAGEEKYSDEGRDHDRRGSRFRDRLVELGAVLGMGAGAAKLLGRQRARDEHSDGGGDYVPPDRETEITQDSLSRIERAEEGRSLPPQQQPLNQPLGHRRSTSSVSYGSQMSASPS